MPKINVLENEYFEFALEKEIAHGFYAPPLLPYPVFLALCVATWFFLSNTEGKGNSFSWRMKQLSN